MNEPVRHGPDCVRALDNLYLFLDHELEQASWDQIHAHIADCEPCLNAFDLEKVVKTLVARSCHESAPAPLRQRVLTSIREVSVGSDGARVTETVTETVQVTETRSPRD